MAATPPAPFPSVPARSAPRHGTGAVRPRPGPPGAGGFPGCQLHAVQVHRRQGVILFAAIPVGVAAAIATTLFREALEGSGLLLFGSRADVVLSSPALHWAGAW